MTGVYGGVYGRVYQYTEASAKETEEVGKSKVFLEFREESEKRRPESEKSQIPARNVRFPARMSDSGKVSDSRPQNQASVFRPQYSGSDMLRQALPQA